MSKKVIKEEEEEEKTKYIFPSTVEEEAPGPGGESKTQAQNSYSQCTKMRGKKKKTPLRVYMQMQAM